jgi:predicted DNA-binding protein (UPF0251 family)
MTDPQRRWLLDSLTEYRARLVDLQRATATATANRSGSPTAHAIQRERKAAVAAWESVRDRASQWPRLAEPLNSIRVPSNGTSVDERGQHYPFSDKLVATIELCERVIEAVGGTSNRPRVVIVEPPRVDGREAIRRPSEKAMAAWRLRDLQGLKQQFIAQSMGTNQGQVSRWMKEVREYLAAGHVLPELPTANRKPKALDPSTLDYVSTRGRATTPRQRTRRDPDAD